MRSLLVVLGLALFGAHDAGGQSRGTVAFVGVNLVPMDRERVLANQTVVVREGRITRIGPAAQTPPPRHATVVDGTGKFLIPGLVDLHVHLGGTDSDRREILRAFLANGVTAVLNQRGSPGHLALRDSVASGAVIGPTIFTAGPFVNEPFFTTADAVENEVRAQKRAGYDFVKIHGDLSADAYARLHSIAKRVGIRVIGHSPRNLGYSAMFEHRQYAVVHAEEFLYDRTGSSRNFAQLEPRIAEIARAAAAARLWVMPNLTAYRNIALQIKDLDAFLAQPAMRFVPAGIRARWAPGSNTYTQRFPPEMYAGFMARYELLEKLTLGFRDAGVRLVVGTDAMNPGTIPGTSAHDELELLVAAGLTPYEALRGATAGAAEFLGSPSIGIIAIGRRADLVLLESNPLEKIGNTREILGVMLRGRWQPVVAAATQPD
jgi:hypothetical protein